MDHLLQQQIRQSLRLLSQFYTAMTQHFETTLSLIKEGAKLDPRSYFDQYRFPEKPRIEKHGIVLDRREFTVTHHKKPCFLNNSISFRLLVLLVEHADVLLSHDEIFEEVWDTDRPYETALRSAIKMLRRKLRAAGLHALAASIDGSVSGHYRLLLR